MTIDYQIKKYEELSLAELYDILVQVKKQREFPGWAEAEIRANLTLGPSFFISCSSLLLDNPSRVAAAGFLYST